MLRNSKLFLCIINKTINVNKVISKKIHYKGNNNKKSLKWYWRQEEYNMFHNEIFKNYLIKRDKVPHVELLPLDEQGNPKYDSCLIWLYDGDYLEMFIDALLEFNNFPPKNFKIVFHRAPINPITFDSLVFERSWFNIFDFPDAAGERDINKKEIESFNKVIQREIKDQFNLIGDYNKIYLGGFSQSACMAVYSTMTCEHKIGGTVAFSGFNFDFTPLDLEKKKVPIICINGSLDEVVIIKHARQSYSKFIKLGFNINFIEEPGLWHHFTKTGLRNANNLFTASNLI
jgi:predicted esterase